MAARPPKVHFFFFVEINLLWPIWRTESSENYTNVICGHEFLHAISSPSLKGATMIHIIHSHHEFSIS